MIDQQIVRHFVHFRECLYHPLPFYATQMIKPFLNSWISANHNKGVVFQPIVKFLYSLMLLQCRISFRLMLLRDEVRVLQSDLVSYLHIIFPFLLTIQNFNGKVQYKLIYFKAYTYIYIEVKNLLDMGIKSQPKFGMIFVIFKP